MPYTTKVVLCDSLDIPADGDASKAVPAGNVVEIALDKGEKEPKSIEEAEALAERKCKGAELTKVRTILTAIKAKVAEGAALESAALAAESESL